MLSVKSLNELGQCPPAFHVIIKHVYDYLLF